ncbi:sterol desaturase family protein [Minwuia thermotolerans]|uniref:Sterol desaturase family protein n=1 Tax=Minwuia thermotolerans TaxID=2056226 RepID=A0A2M9FX90_9PROT|nr:sterol desaturase family protein [Minwuia thermotolerans]PJK28082.1 sterol desaturase family protein [Minwuia thermotolerans]
MEWLEPIVGLLTRFPEIWPRILLTDTARYFVFAAPAALLIALAGGRASRWRIQNRRPGLRDRRREIGFSLLTAIVFSLNGFFLVYGLDWLGLAELRSGNCALTITIETVVLIVLHDAYFYWMHRALHWRPLFRAAHVTHHRSRTPSPWAAYAFAPLEALLEAAFLPIALLAAGGLETVSISIFIVHMMARNVMGHCGHEFLPRRWVNWPLTRWLTTPTHHDIHHELGRWNYGLYFTWWDRWMNTEHPAYPERFRAAAAGRATKPGPPSETGLTELLRRSIIGWWSG